MHCCSDSDFFLIWMELGWWRDSLGRQAWTYWLWSAASQCCAAQLGSLPRGWAGQAGRWRWRWSSCWSRRWSKAGHCYHCFTCICWAAAEKLLSSPGARVGPAGSQVGNLPGLGHSVAKGRGSNWNAWKRCHSALHCWIWRAGDDEYKGHRWGALLWLWGGCHQWWFRQVVGGCSPNLPRLGHGPGKLQSAVDSYPLAHLGPSYERRRSKCVLLLGLLQYNQTKMLLCHVWISHVLHVWTTCLNVHSYARTNDFMFKSGTNVGYQTPAAQSGEKSCRQIEFLSKVVSPESQKTVSPKSQAEPPGAPIIRRDIFCCLVLQSHHICHFFRYTFQNVRFNTKYNYCLNCSLLLLLKPAWKTFRIWVSTHKYCVDTLTELKLDFLFLQILGDLGPKALTIQ